MLNVVHTLNRDLGSHRGWTGTEGLRYARQGPRVSHRMDRFLKSLRGWTDVVRSHIGWRDMMGSHRGCRVCWGLIEAMQASGVSHRLDMHLGSHIF